MLPSKRIKPGVLHLSLLSACVLWTGALAGTVCKRTKPDCYGDDCTESINCEHGLCDAEGQCQCLPCYSGRTCSIYDDKYGPRFATHEDTIIIDATHIGVVYKAVAEDEDLGLTCPLGPGLNTRCPCATIHYVIIEKSEKESNIFQIHDSSGQVFLKDDVQPQPGGQYLVEIVAANVNDSHMHSINVLQMDHLTLTVVVRSDDTLEDLLQKKEPFPDAVPQPSDYDLNYDAEMAGNKVDQSDDQEFPAEEVASVVMPDFAAEPQTLVRRKRETPADDGDTGASVLTLTENATPTLPLEPGMSINYTLEVILPRLTTPMDLVVEIFVMDAVSGITPFALCDPRVDFIGNMIKDSSGAAIDPLTVPIEKKINVDFETFYDRAVINFGQVQNLDTYSATPTDTLPSTIRVLFTAIMIKNLAYTNDTAIVTAGAEYDSEKYVWVSQAPYTFDMASGTTYTDTVAMTGPTEIAQYSGGTFVIDSIITTPFDTFTVEVYSPNEIHDKFSVSQLFLSKRGLQWGCVLEELDETIYYESTTGLTNHRAIYKTNLLLMGLDYTDLAGEAANEAENELDFGFTIFVFGAEAGETFEVGVGVIIGTTKVWTSNHTVTVLAGSTTPTGGTPGTPVVSALVADAPSGGTATYKVSYPITTAALMDCTVTAAAGDKVCGVSYGDVGGNIVFLPKLEDIVVYVDNTATFSFYVNTTGTIANEDNLVFEVSIAYAAAPNDATITCGGVSGTLTAVATGTEGTQDMTGVVSALPDTLTWYEGGQSGLLLTLTFPAGGVPYQSLSMEAAGDLDVTGWGARICKAEVVSAGLGVPCIAGSMGTINDGYVLQKAKVDSVFNDGVAMDMGPACGTSRTASKASDYEVLVKVYYEIPLTQAAVYGSFNVSAGVNMNNDLIWTGWQDFTLTSPPTASPVPGALLSVIPPSPTVLAAGMTVGAPFLLQVTLKTFKQTSGKYRILAEVDNTANIALCRILLLHIGDSYPCVDPEPYFKEDLPYQQTTIIHNPTDWGLSAILDLGVITNMGHLSTYPGVIADQDSIVVGVMVKGITSGTTGTVTVTLDDTGTLGTPISQALNIAADLTPTGNLVVTPPSADTAYWEVMKMVDFSLSLVGATAYSQLAKFTVKHTSPDLKLCFAAVYKVGKNFPCVIPSLTTSSMILDEDAAQTIEVDMLQVCYYKLSDNTTDDEIIIRAGVMFTNDAAASATVIGFITENSTPGTEVSATVNLDATTPYDYGNVSSVGFKLELLDNTTTTVTPGLRLPVGIAFTIPEGVTVPVEVGVMTPSDGGRAYATVHGFTFTNDTAYGKNLGCFLPTELYDTILIQNSSLSNPMIHPSQTDTLVANLKYITNTGLTHMHGTDHVQDDQFWFEADILVADHPNVTTGDIISITFAVKAGDLIFVIDYPLTVDKSGVYTPEIISELFLTTDPAPSPFVEGDQVMLTARLSHEMNVSSAEANNAIMRIFMPKYVSWVNLTDTWTANITGNLTENHYIDFDFDYLFFTDILEVNFSVTIDPDKQLPKGLGLVNATTIMRLVCETNYNVGVLKYCGNTSFVQYQIDGSDCVNELDLDTMDVCQFSASTAIDSTASADMAKSTATGAWSPAVRTGSDWEHYITIDFLRKTRVTEIQLIPVAGKRKVTKFRVQFSHSGHFFVDSCQNDIIVPADNRAKLPGECRFEARFARMVVLEADGTDDGTIGVKFKWYGCHLEAASETCTANLQTVFTDQAIGWRHVALDSTLGILYFCDYNPKKKTVLCYSSVDGTTWTALPSYIGHLVGYDATTLKMYAMDKKNRAMVSSADGVNWAIVDDAVAATIPSVVTPAVAVPGKGSADFSSVTIGSWTADFTGLQFGGVYKAKWSSCCS